MPHMRNLGKCKVKNAKCKMKRAKGKVQSAKWKMKIWGSFPLAEPAGFAERTRKWISGEIQSSDVINLYLSLCALRARAQRAREQSHCLSQSPQGSQRRPRKSITHLVSYSNKHFIFPCELCDPERSGREKQICLSQCPQSAFSISIRVLYYPKKDLS